MGIKQDHGTPFSETKTHATSAVASHAGVSDQIHYITDIAASTDKAGALMVVKQGSTTIWQMQIATTAAGINAHSHTFSSPLKAAAGALVSVTVDGTAACKANISGFTL